MELCLGVDDEIVENIWIGSGAQTNKDNIVMGV